MCSVIEYPSKFDVFGWLPRLYANGTYDMLGRILMLQLQGNGPFTASMGKFGRNVLIFAQSLNFLSHCRGRQDQSSNGFPVSQTWERHGESVSEKFENWHHVYYMQNISGQLVRRSWSSFGRFGEWGDQQQYRCFRRWTDAAGRARVREDFHEHCGHIFVVLYHAAVVFRCLIEFWSDRIKKVMNTWELVYSLCLI